MNTVNHAWLYRRSIALQDQRALPFGGDRHGPPRAQVVPQIPRICDKAVYYCNRGYEKWCDIEDKFCDTGA